MFSLDLSLDSNSSSTAERGAVVLLFVGLVVLLVVLAIFTVDSTRDQILSLELQTVADAAAHAAAIELNGSESGWRNSKRAAIGIIRSSSLNDVDSVPPTFDLSLGEQDPLETDPTYKGTKSTHNSRYEISIERGVYGNDEHGVVSFTSIEAEPKKYGLASFFLANAVRVNIKVDSASRNFTDVLKFTSPPVLERAAVATTDDADGGCVAPFAIPACELFRNLHDRESPEETFDPNVQCRREVIFDRKSGNDRYELHHTPIEVAVSFSDGIKSVKRAPPVLAGELGTFTSSLSNWRNPRAADLVSYLQAGCNRVHIGDFFQPHEGSGYGPDYYLTGSFPETLSSLVAAKINGGEETFSAVFGQVASPKPNFPGNSLAPWPLIWEENAPGEVNKGRRYVWVGGLGQTSPWTNPLCHDENYISANNPNAGVWKTTVALVAPTEISPYSGEKCTDYCAFTPSSCDLTRPDPKPIVVGFVTVYVFDMNLRLLAGRDRDINPRAFPGPNSTNAPSGVTGADLSLVQSSWMPQQPALPRTVESSWVANNAAILGASTNCSDASGLPPTDVHCLPDTFNSLYSPIDGTGWLNYYPPVQYDRGCSGFRARLGCGEKALVTLHHVGETIPQIVQ